MNWKKALTVGALSLATIAGTYSAHEGDCPPFFVRKVGTSGGICIGASVKLEEGAKFYGLVLSLQSGNRGQVNGINAALCNKGLGGKVNGAELSLLNIPQVTKSSFKYEGPEGNPSNVNGIQASICNFANEVNGIQVGIANWANKVYGVQVAPFLNYADKKVNGIQVGILANGTRDDSKVIEVGVYNEIDSSITGEAMKRGCLLNYYFENSGGNEK